MDRRTAHQLLASWFSAAVGAVEPEVAVSARLRTPEVPGITAVLALGKAAPAMTRGVADALGSDGLVGVAVSNHVDSVPTGIELLLGSHPVPTDRSHRAGMALLNQANQLGADDLAIALISGGGSSLAEVPIPDVTIGDIATTNELLLRSGADIFQTNMVRRRLSLFKGGGLARAAAPAHLITLAISDVVGDPVAVIASGPTVASSDGDDDAFDVVRQLGIAEQLPPAVRESLHRPRQRLQPLADHEVKVIASGTVAAHAAAQSAEQAGIPATVVDTRLTGDSGAAVGEVLQRSRGSLSVFAGETTVDVTGDGVGGRNHEAALLAATLIEGRPDVFFLAAGTDGIDGTAAAAGAIVDGTTLARARALGLDAATFLERNDSGTFFAELGDHIVTGPTGTNVGDVWLVLRAD